MSFGGVVQMWQKDYGEKLSYVKGMLDGPVRDMLIVMLEWHIGMKTDFTVNTGKFGKHFEQYFEKDMWEQFKQTFSNADSENVWESFLSWVIYLGQWRMKLLNIWVSISAR